MAEPPGAGSRDQLIATPPSPGAAVAFDRRRPPHLTNPTDAANRAHQSMRDRPARRASRSLRAGGALVVRDDRPRGHLLERSDPRPRSALPEGRRRDRLGIV